MKKRTLWKQVEEQRGNLKTSGRRNKEARARSHHLFAAVFRCRIEKRTPNFSWNETSIEEPTRRSPNNSASKSARETKQFLALARLKNKPATPSPAGYPKPTFDDEELQCSK